MATTTIIVDLSISDFSLMMADVFLMGFFLGFFVLVFKYILQGLR